MLPKQEVVAMLLAGGQGSRLGVLTKNLAKPAVPYGGKYRIIDFPLSNCINSGIETVGVLTQYQPLILNEYIGNGQPWDLDRMNAGVTVLPPYQNSKKFDWYKGTANAIYQNIAFIDRYSPDYVVVLSGDHIYKMDYSEMVAYHKENNAACTIAQLDVTLEEASRFGILNTNPDGSIYEFDEKPKHPKSTKASMGIYVFTWSKLRQYLIDDENNPESSNDFGHDVLPAMLNAGERMMAWKFEGYWKDVGTIASLWDSNMDLLNARDTIDLNDDSWKIFSRNPIRPPHYLAPRAKVQGALITEGCTVYGDVENSVIFANVTIEQGAVVRDSIVMPGATIKAGATTQYAIVGEDAVIGEGAVIGERPEEGAEDWGIAVVGEDCIIKPGSFIKANEMVDAESINKEDK